MTDDAPPVTDGSYRQPIAPEEYDRLAAESAKEVTRLRAKLATQAQRLEDALEAFLRFGVHTPTCDDDEDGGDGCSCGYTQAWRRCLQLEDPR